MSDKFEIHEEEWEKSFKSANRHSMCARTNALLFQIYAGIAYTNKDYKRFGHKEDDKCTFCKEEKQSFMHLFMECAKVIEFRGSLKSLGKGISQPKEWFIGTDGLASSFLIRETLCYIQRSNWEGTQLSSQKFKGILIHKEKVAADIATRKNKLFDHLTLWEEVFSLLTDSN